MGRPAVLAIALMSTLWLAFNMEGAAKVFLTLFHYHAGCLGQTMSQGNPGWLVMSRSVWR